ncbi:MAG TPA: glutathione synthase [Alphaproteobacteria bacterium]|nr:glutathione synthase [Alphaproteobacteria bacterium]
MTLTCAIQMDPIEAIDIDSDSTFSLALEATARGHVLYHYLPRDISLSGGRVTARGRRLEVRSEAGDHFTLGEFEVLDLAAVDVVLMRQDPPFDMAYITATHILEQIHPGTLVVNDPAAVRNAPEKIFVTRFLDLMPPTLITSDAEAIKDFRKEHGDIIIKPLFGNGGVGVFHLKPDDDNLTALLEMFANIYREPLVAQAYVARVREGDKRIILVDGEAAGAVNRVPAPGEARANLHVGARAEKAELTARDKEICAVIGPALKERGLIFAGIDVIGGYLTEINVTSPTGIREIRRFGGPAIEARIWDAMEARL